MDRYNQQLQTIINTHNSIIGKPLHSNIDELRAFFSSINTLVSQFSTGAPRSNTFIKTFYLQIWNIIQRFVGGGQLIGDSANCKFTIADLTFAPGNVVRTFFKIVNQASQVHPRGTIGGEDLIICDIISATIIERLRPKYKKLSYHFPKYVDSSLGYYIGTRNREYWSFDDIRYNNNQSVHNYNSIINPHNPTYKNRCMIMVYEAVNLLSFEKVFTNYNTNRSVMDNKMNCLNVLGDFYDLVNTLKYLGVYYGFIHNDLHSTNIIYNQDTKKLMFIDLGRVSFCKYIDRPSSQINADVAYQFYKMGYDDLYSDIRTGVNTYTELYRNQRLFRHRISEKVSTTRDKEIYYGFIFDLITLTLQFYIKSLYFFSYENPTLNGHISPFLMNIVKINYNNNVNNLLSPYRFEMTTVSLDNLFRNFDAAKNFINSLNESHNISTADVDKIKDFYNEIANGLLMTAIFFHLVGIGINNRPMKINAMNHDNRLPIYWALQIMDYIKLRDYFSFLTTLYNNPRYTAQMNRVDFIQALFDSQIVLPSELSRGGMTMTKKSYLVNGIDFGMLSDDNNKQLKQYSTKSSSKSVFSNSTTQNLKVDIETVLENYENTFNDKFKQQINYPVEKVESIKSKSKSNSLSLY